MKLCTIDLKSAAFAEGGTIPKRHTADGPDLSPPLTWSAPPEGTAGFALVCDDPDAPAGTWVHWVLFDLPSTARGLPEGVAADPTLLDGSRQGRNDFGRIGYGGPSPPRGPAHRYIFRLYALDRPCGLAPGIKRGALEAELKGHILAEGLLTAKYGRS